MTLRELLSIPTGAIQMGRLQRQQWLSPEKLDDLQWRRFVSLVRHAEARVPFYRERFRAAGFRSEDLRSRDELSRIPITRREDLQSPERLIADTVDRGELRSSHTSGSTGRPTTTYFDPRGWILAKHVLKLRARAACGLRPWHRVAIVQEDVPRQGRKGLGGRRASFSIHRPLAEVGKEILAYAPTALYGPPSYLGRLLDTGVRIPSVRQIFTSAEMLDVRTRRKLSTGFEAPVMDIYGCTEVKEVAWQCPEQDGYHINAEWVLVETVGPEGRSDEGEGRILLTSLYNRGMPLLRYEVGDTGRLLDGTCPCGRGLPLMTPVLGRSADYLHLPGGTAVSPYSLTCAVEHVPAMRQYQIVQEAEALVRVRVVPGEGFREGGRRAVRAALGPILPGVAVKVELVQEIPSEPSGKFRIVRSDVLAKS